MQDQIRIVYGEARTMSRADRDEKGRFVPGVSGNPLGRRPQYKVVQDLARSHTVAAITTLVEVMIGRQYTGAERVRAAQLILDRGWGKPETRLELTGADAGPIEIHDPKDRVRGMLDGILERHRTPMTDPDPNTQH